MFICNHIFKNRVLPIFPNASTSIADFRVEKANVELRGWPEIPPPPPPEH